MKVSFDEIGHMSATFATDKAKVGDLCKVAENGKVIACSDGDTFCGKVETVRNGFAGVQLHGFAELPYTGGAPVLGYSVLAADGKNGVKTNATGRNCLVVSVDTGKKTAIIEL